MPGDYDGDGLTDFAVWRPSDGFWHVMSSATGTIRTQQWGLYGDVPVPGDYDGDGRADFAVWRPGDGTWFVMNSVSGAVRTQQFGQYGDVPVPGQYDDFLGDDFTVWRPSTGAWYTLGSSQFGVVNMTNWGVVVDVPSAAHFNCYTSERAIFRPSSGTWMLPGLAPIRWGFRGDIPVAGNYTGDFSDDFAVWRPSDGTWYVLENPRRCLT